MSKQNDCIGIPKYKKGSLFGSYDSKDDCTMYMFRETSKDDYQEYLVQLLAEGYLCYDMHQIEENYHSTFVMDGKQIVHVYFTACDSTTRIIVDPNTKLYNKAREFFHERKEETVLYQFELDYRMIDCGMCYVTRCEDGSFFIIDSAHRDSVNDHIRLYEFLSRLTPENEEIIISGWFFSHAHQDHIEKFMSFIEAGFKRCKIECLYFNFPALTTKGNENWKDDDKVTMREFDQLLCKHKEIPIIKLHTGQRFFVRNLEFEVLATHEDIYPQELARFNDSSTVLFMQVEGCKVLFLGDANIIESNILTERYGNYLKSDVVQISHHGYNGATVEVYEKANADVALFPVSLKDFNNNLIREPNKKALELCKEYYIAGNGTVGLALPYKLESVNVMEREITDKEWKKIPIREGCM